MEEFALAADRRQVLEQLIPGTEERSYHECLLLQHEGRLAEVKAVLDAWISRHGRTSLVQEIEARQALLRWDKEPEGTLGYLRDRLRPSLDHEREVDGQKTSYPTALEPELVAREAWVDRAFDHSGSANLQGFKDAALEELLDRDDLDGDRRRALLQRLRRPDHPRIVDRIVEDWSHPRCGSFGSLAIHRALTDEQLDSLARKVPDLLTNQEWVHEKCKRLRPGPDVDWETDPALREAYLERLWRFVGTLPPAFNALKAHVLYHRLDLDRSKGVFDRGRFLEYARLPRSVSYAEPAWLKVRENKDHLANLQDDFRAVTLLPPVRDDEGLVRDYLASFFVRAADWKPFETWIRDGWLKPLFATTKILAGEGNQDQWYSLLADPTGYQALRDRVDLDLAPTNRTSFAEGDAVSLDVWVKNVPRLVVKVFEINALNYLLANGREPDTSIDLDGLVPSEQTAHEYPEPPLRRVRRTLSFPSLRKGGVFVVELIGNGKSSRALVKKGRLRYLERLSAAGHVFTVLDEANAKRADATLWLGGREYGADADGTITVPWSTAPRRQAIVLRSGELATLESFQHQAEVYSLLAGIHVDRESLVAGRQAQVVVRAQLLLGGRPVSLSLVQSPKLVLRTTDRHGTSASKELPLELHADRESTTTFQVPEDLSSLELVVTGRVEAVSTGAKVDLSAEQRYELNGIEQGDATEDLHLARTEAGYVVSLLGKTGEPRADRPVQLTFAARDFVPTLDVTLQTDAHGRVALGHLEEVESVTATSPSGVGETWSPGRDSARYPRFLNVRAGEPLALPYVGDYGECAPEAFSLLERAGETYRKDCFAQLALRGGFLEVAALPAGDYELVFKETGLSIHPRATAGRAEGGWLVSGARFLETRPGAWLQIAALEPAADALRIRLANATRATRVHVVATRFSPAHALGVDLGQPFLTAPRATTVSRQLSSYVSGRDLGDEYRYVLDRKLARKLPGNLLARPGLLLNPWAMRKTETDVQSAMAGGAYAASAPSGAMSSLGAPAAEPMGGGGLGSHPSLDFLAEAPAVFWNLRPDEKGVVSVPRSALAHASEVRVLALDGESAVLRSVALPEVSEAPRDRRLLLGLDPAKHFAQKKQVSVLTPGVALEVADVTTSKVEAFDTLGRVHGLYRTLTSDAHLATFSFVLDWPRLSRAEKGSKLSEFACHELHFFVAKKDPDYFREVVAPYLANKRAKTFLDLWLLGADLSEFLRPWAHGRLNVVEKILLAQRVASDRAATARHVSDLFQLLPRDVEGDNRLFLAALQGSALDTDDALGFGAASRSAEKAALESVARDMARGGPGGGGAVAGMAFKSMSAMPAMAPPPPPAPAPSRAPAPKMSKRARAESKKEAERYDADEEAQEVASLLDVSLDEAPSDGLAQDLEKRKQVRALYRSPETTQELGESNYYRCVVEEQGPDRVRVNAFWRDYARHEGKGPFLSAHFARATGNFTEMMFALSVLDLPFERTAPSVAYEGSRMKLEAKRETIVFHEEIKPASPAERAVPVLVSQNYFRADDRTRVEEGEEVDKYVDGEMLVHVVYVTQVVLTNPTSSRQKLDLVLQIPRGAIPVRNGFRTKGETIVLESYSTHSLEYAFYFPAPGEFFHYPVHVSKDEALVASAPARPLRVVLEPTSVDRTSWAWVSQHGSTEDVLRFLDENAIERLELERIAWRMKDRKAYEQVLALLLRRHVWDETLAAYALRHGDAANVREYLLHQESFLRSCGLALESPLVAIDPVRRGWYEHREYAPLVNARAHKLGAKRRILNDRFAKQYAQWTKLLTYRPKLGPDDHLVQTAYHLLQDRVDEALASFARADRAKVEAKLQHDYLGAYLAFYGEDPAAARPVAQGHANHPVDRWRNLFRTVLAHLDEAEGKGGSVVDPADRTQKQSQLAATEAALEVKVEDRKVEVTYQNLAEARVSYYLMDIELLFSRQPFVQQQTSQFSLVKPNRSEVVRLPAGQTVHSFPLPQELHGANVVVEVVAGGLRRSQAYYAHALQVTVIEPMGQVRVLEAKTQKPLPRTYVKAYARTGSGQARFFKDGYTDLRGRFDYASISTNDLDGAERFALLVLSEAHGAVIREAEPPRR